MANQTSPRILSIRQPWASWIAQGVKDVENRTWATQHRGLLIVHASQRVDATMAHSVPDDAPRGAIVGVARVIDCVRDAASPWAERGAWHWLLGDARELVEPIPFRGMLGLMPLHPQTIAAVMRRVA